MALVEFLRRYLGRPDVPVILTVDHPAQWPPQRLSAMNVSAALHRAVFEPNELVQAALRALGRAPPAAQRQRWQYPLGPASATAERAA